MRGRLGLLALVGAGVGYLMYTRQGRDMINRAGDVVRNAKDGFNDYRSRKATEGQITEALERPHPDTAVAHAFEQAVTPS